MKKKLFILLQLGVGLVGGMLFAQSVFGAVIGPTVYPPTLTLSASPTLVMPLGGSSTISWSTTYATGCSASPMANSFGTAPSGSVTLPISSNTTFTMTCTGDGGSVTKSVTVSIDTTYSCTSSGSGCSCYVNLNAECGVSDNGNGCTVVQDSNRTYAGLYACMTQYNTYQPYCGGTITCQKITPAPTANISANPLGPLTSGTPTTLTWSSTNATSCVGTNFSTGAGNPTSGTASVTPISPSTTYTVTCYNSTNSATASVTVTVNPATKSLVIDANNLTFNTNTNTITEPVTITATNFSNPDSIIVDLPGILHAPGVISSKYPSNLITSSSWTKKNVSGNTTTYTSNLTTEVTHTSSIQNGTIDLSATGENTNGIKSINTSISALPSGTISCTNCTIASGASTCNSTLNWSTSNLPAGSTTEITRDNPANTHVSWNTSGTNVTNTINYGTSNFYVYNSGQSLATASCQATTCASGTAWDGTKCSPIVNGSCSNPLVYDTCVTGTPGNFVNGATKKWDCIGSNTGATASCQETMSGTLSVLSSSPNPCTIASGASTCSTILSWGITNPQAFLTAITANGMSNINVSTSLASPQSGTQSVTVPYSSRTFYLYNNGFTLAQTTVSANCASGTSWATDLSTGTGKCAPSPISVTLSASPTSMTLPSNSTVLSWTTTGTPDSCTASGSWSGSKTATAGPNSETRSSLTAGTYTYTITCSKAGVSDVASSVIVNVYSQPPPTGSISATSCQIASGASTCPSSVSWSTADLPAGSTTEVTRDNPANTHVSSLTSGTVSNNINYGTSNFYVYNSSQVPELASVSATATCASGTGWNGTNCATISNPVNGSCSATHYNCASGSSANNVNGASAYTWDCVGSNGGSTASCSESNTGTGTMTGTLSATACTIAKDATSCDSTITWSTQNPVATSGVRSPWPSADTHVSSPDANSGNTPAAIPYNSRAFYLYNNGQLLSQINVVVQCVSGTYWNDVACVTDNVTPSPTATLKANPSSILKGASSTLTWSSTNATSCSGTNFSTGTGNPTSGNVSVSPSVTTTYGVVCIGSGGQAPDQATVTVTVQKSKKPLYKEQ